MKPQVSGLLHTFFLSLVVVSFAGCASVVVREDHRVEQGRDRQTKELLRGEALQNPSGQSLRLAMGTKEQDPSQRLGALVEAARLALPNAAKDSTARQIYAVAVSQIVGEMREKAFTSLPVDGAGAITQVSLSPGKGLDPRSTNELIPVSSVRVDRMPLLATQTGIGVPYAAVFDKANPAMNGQPGLASLGMVVPVTAVLTFEQKTARLMFVETLDSTSMRIGGRTETLAADFTTPFAIDLSRGRNNSLDLFGMLRPDKRMEEIGLYQLQPYDPDKIPIILVHGLMSRPETWRDPVNHFLADPEIRQRYQFWYFLYPTGLPVWGTSSKLRHEIDRFDQVLDPRGTNPRMKEKVVIGHSMGGLVSNLLTREGGWHLWGQFSDVDPSTLNVGPEVREMIQNFIFFKPRKDVSRVIFASTPHRGSPFALRPISNFGASLIRLPFAAFDKERPKVLQALREDTRSLFVAPANSIRFLKAESPLLLALLELPKSPRVRYHSIVGDRGRGDAPESTDGIVPYSSSYLADAESEKIVPSGHGSHNNPQGIAEMIRILSEHTGSK